MYFLQMQDNGDVAIRIEGESDPVWRSETDGKGEAPYRLTMQEDGNLVAYDGNNDAIWATGTDGQGEAPYKVRMQNDRNVVIYDRNRSVIWASSTCV